MSESALHRQVVLATLIALAGVSGAISGVAAQPGPDASLDTADVTDGVQNLTNVTVSTNASDGEILLARPVENQTFHLQTNADANTSFDVEIETENRLYTTLVTVDESGNGTLTYNITGISPETEFELTVVSEDHETTSFDGRFVNESVLESITAPETTTTDGGSESSVPGFGVPVALVAMGAGVALARRT